MLKMNNCSDDYDLITKLKVGVHKKFAELRAALQMREKLLLRQLEVVASTKQRMAECGADSSYVTLNKSSEGDNIKILFENEEELLGSIRTFGRFQLGSMLLALKQEEYITPNWDHEIMYKNIQSDDNQFNTLPQQNQFCGRLVLDKSLIEHNAKYINDSIVNITLEEAKELIRNAGINNEVTIPLLNLEELDDELESSIVDAVSNLSRDSNTNVSETFKHNLTESGGKNRAKSTKFGRSKQKITINNCSGTINLQNISSVTINCGNEKCEYSGDLKPSINLADSKKWTSTDAGPVVPLIVNCVSEYSSPSSADSFSNQSSNPNSRSQSKKKKKCKTNAEGINNKNKDADTTLQSSSLFKTTQHVNNVLTNTESNTAGTDTDTESKTLNCNFYNRLLNEIKRNIDQQKSSDVTGRLLETTLQREPHQVLKNFKNLNIVLENDRQDETTRPVHIEHWLSEIIKDTDLEPMQNTDMLEHSKINE